MAALNARDTDSLLRREQFAVSLRRQKKNEIIKQKRSLLMMKKANQKMQVEVVADHEEASEESELTTFETMQDLY